MNIDLQEYIIIGQKNKKITKKDEKILSDSCEALIGAVYIDQGYNYAKDFVISLWENEIKKSDITILDPKTKLQEYSLKKYKKLPIYKLLTARGPKHKPVFKISVSIQGSKDFQGTGNSKQKAEQNSAYNLLRSFKNI